MRGKMLFIGCIVCLSGLAQAYHLSDILEDIYGQIAEYEAIPMEQLTEQLMEIANHPINLNHTNAEELSQLCWLSDEQIDDILLYQYQHPFVSVYDLQLIQSLKYYEIRNLLPFVYVGEVEEKDKIYFREIFHYAKHEMTLRTDARHLEDFDTDPIYGKFRYRFDYQKRVQAGLTVCRPTGQDWKNTQYGAYIQLQDIGVIKNLSAGNFQANFGQGLVIGTPFKMGKTRYVGSHINAQEGVKKYTSVGDDFAAFHGIGTTLRFRWAEMSALYSLQQQDSTWHHLLGVNATAKWKKFKIGITAIENLYTDSTASKAVMGINARYNWGKIDIWGELATTQDEKWGWGGIIGIDFVPISNIHLLGLYRYYSPFFNNPYAYAFSEKTRIKDENGFYIGIDVQTLAHWRFSSFVDAFREGYDAMIQTDFIPNSTYDMNWRIRAKRKDNKDTYACRYRFTYQLNEWVFRTQADLNFVKKQNWNYGVSLLQDIEYRSNSIPLVFQLRLQAFDARQWDNRIYAYENDVLYAYSIPNVYGLGGRFWLNARYKINDIFSIYLRVSETLYQKTWAIEHDKKCTRTDIHTLLRIKL